MQVCVEEDEVNVALQVLQAPKQQLLTLLLRLTTFDLRKEKKKKRGNIKTDGNRQERH